MTWSSRYMAYRRPEHPPGWTAMRSAMSSRPSSVRSSLTFPAAFSVRLIIGSSGAVVERADTRDCNRRTRPERERPAQSGGERGRRSPPSRGAGRRGSGGRPSPAFRPRPRSGPTRSRSWSTTHVRRSGWPNGGVPPTANPVAARASSGVARRTVAGPDELRQLRLVHPVRPAGERHDRAIVRP